MNRIKFNPFYLMVCQCGFQVGIFYLPLQAGNRIFTKKVIAGISEPAKKATILPNGSCIPQPKKVGYIGPKGCPFSCPAHHAGWIIYTEQPAIKATEKKCS